MKKNTGQEGEGLEAGAGGIEVMLLERYPRLTQVERAIADFFLSNLQQLPFETGASIAEKSNVSEMTVVRFIRSLGYRNLKHLKSELRSEQTEDRLDNVFDRFKVRVARNLAMRESLELEIQAVARAYDLTTGEKWPEIVAILTGTENVYVVGFQASLGLALDFSTRLKTVRKGVRFAESVDGTYSEVLESDPESSCLVIVDTIAYHRKALLLARKAREMEMPLIVVTDRFSNWAREFTDNVLAVHTNTRTFWDSPASLAVILNLLIDSVASSLGRIAEERQDILRAWTREFGDNEPY